LKGYAVSASHWHYMKSLKGLFGPPIGTVWDYPASLSGPTMALHMYMGGPSYVVWAFHWHYIVHVYRKSSKGRYGPHILIKFWNCIRDFPFLLHLTHYVLLNNYLQLAGVVANVFIFSLAWLLERKQVHLNAIYD